MQAHVVGSVLAIALTIAACSTEVGPTWVPVAPQATDDPGPLAIAVGFNGDKARNEGRLDIGDACVYLGGISRARAARR